MIIRYSKTQEDEYARYVAKLPDMDAAALYEACKQMIWLSAYASNNPRSNFHRMVDALYDECQRRGQIDLYKRAYDDTLKGLS